MLAEDREVLTKGMPVIREAVPGRVASAANRWRRYIKLPLRDESGRVMGVVGVAEDITDRYLAERDLRESRQLLQTVFDALPVWVFVKDRQRRTVMINRRMAIDYGLDLMAGRRLSFASATGMSIEAMLHAVRLSHPELGHFDLEVGFSTAPLRRNLLGRDFFDLAQIGFRERHLVFYVTPEP